MNIVGGLALYFVIWWITLVAVLPFGIRSQQESGDVVDGTEPGLLPNAPASLPIRALAGDGVGNEAILAAPILRRGTASLVPLAAGR